ncbi:hypothetical protein [Pelagicoccus sp. SDUM812005]|uniref:hypothetical protein n=1 Tax=Pelagicoccus sp. SDUM812005 TaxID=3041257 RepID=UPI00280EC167|nr:hypothetical protein [Pelagicoccus sp. SDUM812005]MDQ8182586.1 hypothetical protein [Pelagicoccus sp. SDUM812005]
MPEPQYTIEPLDPKVHDRSSFRNEEKALESYIQTQARKDAKARASTCFVLTSKSAPEKILGYCTLSNASIDAASIPEELKKQLKLPSYSSIPASLLGRIARDTSAKGTPVGKLLMASLFKRAIRTADEIGSIGIILDPKNDRLVEYYSSYGFKKLSSRQMLLPMDEALGFLTRHYQS